MSERMSNVDGAWLRMEQPTNPMMITGFFTFASGVDEARVLDTLRSLVGDYERFRQRVVAPRRPFASPRWETVDNFDVAQHLDRDKLPAPGSDVELRAAVDQLISTPLDLARPPWQAHLLHGYRGGSVLVFRLHHCIADGIALLHVLMSLCETIEGKPLSLTAPTRPRGTGSALRRAVSAMTFVPRCVGSFAQLVFRTSDAQTAFRGPLSTRKRASWSAPLPLEDVKRVGRALDCTVNDVLMAAVGGALRDYLATRGTVPDRLDLTTTIPVNLRPMERAGKLGNRFGLVSPRIPVGESDPVERVKEMHRRVGALKKSTQAVATFAALTGLGSMAPTVQRAFIRLLSSKTTGVMTNVPGPRERLRFAGAEVDRIMFWVPASGTVGLGVSIFSYAGEVTIGVVTDAALVEDPDAVAAAVPRQLEVLLARVEGQRTSSGSDGDGRAIGDEVVAGVGKLAQS